VNKLNKEVIRTETEVFDFQGELDKLERKNIATGDNDVADGKLHAIKELEKEQNKTEDELYEVQEEASQLRKEFKTIGSIINKIVTETLKIDLDNEFGGSIPKNNRTGDYEITEDNLL
jgi:predicted  nucleic acid-binding Zn-ribbon protein